jgi:hypothetical protein
VLNGTPAIVGQLTVELYKVPDGRSAPLRKAMENWPRGCTQYFRRDDGVQQTFGSVAIQSRPSGELSKATRYRFDGDATSRGYDLYAYDGGYLMELTWMITNPAYAVTSPALDASIEASAQVVRRQVDKYLPTTFDQKT